MARLIEQKHLRDRLRPAGHVQVRLQHAHESGHPHAEDVRFAGAPHALRHGQVLPLQRGLHLYLPTGPVFDYWTVMNLKEAI